MAYFIQDVFEFAANTAINLSRIVNRLATVNLGIDDILGDNTDKLCAASIRYAEKTWDSGAQGLDDVALRLTNSMDSNEVNFALSKGEKLVAIDDVKANLNYTYLLAPSDNDAGKQRYTIAFLLTQLSKAGYSFTFKLGQSAISNQATNQPIVEIIASNSEGRRVNVNEMLLKYGACKYSELGVDEGGGYTFSSKSKMREIDAEAWKKGEGLNKGASTNFGTKEQQEKNREKKLQDNYKTSHSGNSKKITNKALEERFERDGDDAKAMFKVGDTWLEIPPTHITVTQMRNSYSVPLIGSESKPLATPVNRTIIKINAVFTGEQIFDDLVRILTQFRLCPINMLRSKDLFNRVAGSDSNLRKVYAGFYYIPVTMDQYTLFNVDGHPGTISAVFQFSLFNFAAYVPNPQGLEYFEYDEKLGVLLEAVKDGSVKIEDITGNIHFDKLKVTASYVGDGSSSTKTTWRLEEASHPYNSIIEGRIKELRSGSQDGQMYDINNSKFQIWKVDMDRYFNATEGLTNKDIEIDKEKSLSEFMSFCISKTPMFTEIAQSISVNYNNVFAYQPVLSQSQAVAQYVGPGETTISVNLKGVNMSTDYYEMGKNGQLQVNHDQKLMGNLLKTWAETYGTAQYGFFDDRYVIRATILNIADVNIVSVQNTVCTSVESKPGLFDVNVLFSKSMFEYNLRNSAIATLDEYFGLQRMSRIYGQNPRFQEIATAVNEKVKESLSYVSDRLGDGLSLTGSNVSLNVVLNDVLREVKSSQGSFWNGKIEDPSLNNPKYTNIFSNSFTYLKNKSNIRFTFDVVPEKENLALSRIAEVRLDLVGQDKEYLRKAITVSKWKNAEGSDVLKNGKGRIYVDVKASPLAQQAIKGINLCLLWNIKQIKDTDISSDEVYKSLAVAVNADSYNVDSFNNKSEEEEDKVKYRAFNELKNQISSAMVGGNTQVPFGIVNANFERSVDGKMQPLWENPEFMEAFYALFLSGIRKDRGVYESQNGRFDEHARLLFVGQMVKEINNSSTAAYEAGWSDKGATTGKGLASDVLDKKVVAASETNHILLVNGDAVVIEYTSPVAKRLESTTFGTHTKTVDEEILDKVNKIIKKSSDGRIFVKPWTQSKRDPNKWVTMVWLTAKGKNAKISDTLSGELAKYKKELQELERTAKAQSYCKPYAAHRYYPLSDGFVGWSQILGSTVGEWFVYEREEETVRRLNRIKQVARTAKPFNRDAKLFDRNLDNSAYIRSTEADGLLDYTDTSSPLSVLAAIARPKMLRDMSAVREVNGERQSVVPHIQFFKKKGMLFGEDAIRDEQSQNQVFNTMVDYVMYMDKQPENNQVDYKTPKGVGVRATFRNQVAEQDAARIQENYKINKDQYNYLVANGVNRSSLVSATESTYHYNAEVSAIMRYNANKVTSNSVVVGNSATALGDATGKELEEAGINQLGYQFTMGGSNVMKPSTASMMINGGYGALNTGMFPRGDVPYDSKTGKPVAEEIEDTQVIPETVQHNLSQQVQTVTGDKLTNMLAASYIEGLPSTKGVQNAFPTYKMYIIESDTSDYKFSSLDNYWDYRLVQDIMVVRDKNTPTHMLKARVIVDPRYITIGPDYKFRTGVENRMFGLEDKHIDLPVVDRDTFSEASTYFKDKAPLRPGMRICIKLGYHTDPRLLDTVFIGTITQLNGSLDSGLYDLAAEGDGRELRVPAVHFSDKFSGTNYTDIINAILRINPNVVHFGKVYGSFLKRLSYGHKNLAQLGMLGLSAAGAFGVGALGMAVPGGAAAWAGRKMCTFASASKLIAGAGKAGLGATAVAGTIGAVVAGAATLPIAFGEFQQMGQWANPAFEEVVSRSILETDWAQDLQGRTEKTLLTNLPYFGTPVKIPLLGELPGIMKGNVFNANKQAYQLSKHFYQTYKYGNNPIDDNIFAVDIWSGMINKASLNINNKRSIWDVLQTVRRLYPNYALDVRPYGSRSTIFLGPVGFNYWRTDDPVQAMLPQINTMEGIETDSGMINQAQRKGFDAVALHANTLGDTDININTKLREGNNNLKTSLGLTRAPFIPFQKHHLITSDEDIIMNGLKPTPERGWNAVSLTYGTDPSKIDASNVIEKMADIDLYPEVIRKESIHIDFTTDREVATRYALGYLKEGVEKLYGGTIIVKGNSKIEPYDKIYIHDTVNKMYGWVQVETVIHKFDQEMGFTTHIVPNMVCEINNNAYLTQQDIVMSTINDKVGFKKLASDFALGAAGTFGASLLGLSASPLFAVGIAAAFLLTSVKDVQEAYKSGKDYIEKYKNLQMSESKLYAEKVMLQEIMSSAIEQKYVIKGLKFGWAAGYLVNRGAADFIFKPDVTLAKQLDNAASNYMGKVKKNADAIKKDIGEKVEVVKNASKVGELKNSIKDKLDLLKDKAKLDETQLKSDVSHAEVDKQYQDLYKKYRNAVAKNDKAAMDAALTELKSLSSKSLKTEVVDTAISTLEKFNKEIIGVIEEIELTASKSGVVSSFVKGSYGSVAKGFTGGFKLLGKLFGLGGLSWLAMGVSEFLPSMGYSFAVKAVTENNVMLVSPIFWRDNYLMPLLDGYMGNDAFMHIGDMLINYNNSLTEAKNAANKYFREMFPTASTKINVVSEIEGAVPVTVAMKEEMNAAGEFLKCVLKGSKKTGTLSDADIDGNLFSYIAASIRNNENIGGVPRALILLAALYTENRFKLNGKSNKNAYGLCQIVPSVHAPLLAKNANDILYPVVDGAMRGKIANGDFVDALNCNQGAGDPLAKYYIEFNIRSMAQILNDSWDTARKKFLSDVNSRVYKARQKSNMQDVIDAVLIYGGYVGYGSKSNSDTDLEARINSGDLIKDDGSVVQSAKFSNYSAVSAIWSSDGFLKTYLAMREAYLKCKEIQDRAEAKQKETEKKQKSVDDFNNWSAESAKDTFGKSAKLQNGVKPGDIKLGTDVNKDSWDCSGFVKMVLLKAITPYSSVPKIQEEIKKIKTLTGSNMNSQAMYDSPVGKFVDIVNAQPGDLVFFKDSAGRVKHIEICVGDGNMVGVSYREKKITIRRMVGTHKQYGLPEVKSIFNYKV